MAIRWRILVVVACVVSSASCSFPRPPEIPECTSPDAPACVNTHCVSPGCRSNDDCAGTPATPFCQTASGKCVGCLDNTSCFADKPVCDTGPHVCRACDRDDQCPSGVCVDAEGRCALANEVVFLRDLNS